MDDNIVDFPALGDRPQKALVKAPRYPVKCKHGEFIVDDQLDTVECGKCGEKLSPMWVLLQFAYKDSQVRQRFAINEALVEEISKKTKCKCEHCGKLTKIASRQEANRAYNHRSRYD